MAQKQTPKRLSRQATRIRGRLPDDNRTKLAPVIQQVERELGNRIKKVSSARIALARLKVARLREGLTLGEVAKKTGIDPGNLSKLENSVDNVEFNTLARFADALGYDVVVDIRKRD